MPRYTVGVTKTVTYTAEVEVEAKDEEEAETLAIAMAGKYDDWEEGDVYLDVNEIDEM